MMEQGDPLPEQELLTPEGAPLPLRSLVGEPLVLFFFPKADTPGCTQEAKDFSDLAADFGLAGIALLGVSRDAPRKLARFAEKHHLLTPLGSDEGGAVTEAFGVWGEKTLYGKTYMGIERATFLFDAAGRLAMAWRKVKVPGHAAHVLEVAQSAALKR